jgi:hypothetical protein
VLHNTTTAGNISFAARQDFSTGNQPQGVCVADLNDDGKTDIMVVNAVSSTLTILRNTSTASTISFAQPLDFLTGTKPWRIATCDINGDGKLDIAVANMDGNNISVFRNTGSNGNMAFDNRIDFGVGSGPRDVAFGDLNGDGKADMVVSNSFSNSISILRNTSNGSTISFASRADYATALFPQTISVEDIDGDGKLDIAVATYNNSGFVSVLRNKINEPSTTISSFTPTSGFIGTVVTITGTNFTGANAVSFGGTAASSFTVNSPTQITATVANGATGNVFVSSPSGIASLGTFTYSVPPPTLTSFNPTSGTTGTVVTLIGTNFINGQMNVQFGGVYATNVTFISSTQMTAVVGFGASGIVSVSSILGGTAGLPGFTYIPPPPVISSFTPATGTVGTVVTITGQNFTGATGVSFGGTQATSFTVMSPASITATVSTGASGNVSVTTPGGTGSLAGFVYNPPTAVGNPGSNNSLELLVSPNPSEDEILITHPSSFKNTSLRFVDILGREIKMLTPLRNSRQTRTNVKTFMPGIYRIIWTDGTRILTRTLMVK